MPTILIRDGAWYTTVGEENQHPTTKTLYWAVIYMKVSFVHFLNQYRMKINTSKEISRRLQLSSGGLKSLTAQSGAS
jgi:hypothetical protein